MSDNDHVLGQVSGANAAIGSMLGLAYGDCVANGGGGGVTAQTQLALSVADGLIRAWVRFSNGKQTNPMDNIERAVRRWAAIRDPDLAPLSDSSGSAWLGGQMVMGRRPIPSQTIVAALGNRQPFGAQASNSSLGAACVPQAAPIGLVPSGSPLSDSSSELFDLAKSTASMTHGHPTAHVAAGAFALLLHSISNSSGILDSAQSTLSKLQSDLDFDPHGPAAPVREKMQMALDRSSGGGEYSKAGDFSSWKGHTADEAFAIGLWAALRADTISECVSIATSGVPEKHATAAIAGSIWGAARGSELVPATSEPWDFVDSVPQATDIFSARELEQIEGREVIEAQMANFFRILELPGRISRFDQFRWPGL